MSTPHFLFIINPISGNKKGEKVAKYINKKYAETALNYKILFTKYEGHAKEIAKHHLTSVFNYFVVIGGDGTVNQVSTEIKGTDKILSIIPIGSGNGLAHHINKTKNIKKILKTLTNNQNQLLPTLIDCAKLNKHYFYNLSGIGFDGYIAQYFNTNKTRGFYKYLILIIKNYFNYQPVFYDVILDKKTIIKGTYLMVCISNGKEFGNHLIINPKAEIDNGYLTLCLVRKPTFFDWPSVIISLLFYRKISNRILKTYNCENCFIKTQKSTPYHTDGEFISSSLNTFSAELCAEKIRAVRIL